MIKYGEVLKVNYVIGFFIYKYVVYWLIKWKNINDFLIILIVLIWWFNDVLIICIRRIVKLVVCLIIFFLIICYIDISVSLDLKEIFIIVGYVYV